MSGLPHLTLVLGGARSGKSAHAERLIGTRAAVYVATAQVRDDEMAERVARHRARRGDGWSTLEEPLDLAGVVARNFDGRPVLIDCLTLWLTNVMLADRNVGAAVEALCAALKAASSPVICVTNEVGLGIVPDNALARRFRDEAGRLNQAVAAIADRVDFIAAGLALRMK
ncbi:MAG: bifunctional adenosylcobinamide kinase/adenosylcobinamide-phosphate guanylyltransferase [Rhodospirillaceae bacterium]